MPCTYRGFEGRDSPLREMRQTLAARRQPSLFYGESVCGEGVVALAGLEDDGREFGLIRRVGKVLGFQAEGVAARIGYAALAGSFAI